MKAMRLEQHGPVDSDPLRWAEVDDPAVDSRQIRVKVRCCAVCRTDLHVIEGDLPTQRMPIIPGHQIVGVVDQVADDCRHIRPGMRVGIAWLRQVCGECEFCSTGRENLCASARFTGYHEDGGYAEYATVDERFAYTIPEQFEDLPAATLLCAGIIGYRSLNRANVPRGGRVLLVGFGSSAHLVLPIALHRGLEVYVTSRGESHRQLAMRMGARWAGPNLKDVPVDIDSVIMFAPAGGLLPPAMERIKPGGTLACAGIHMSEIPPMDYQKHLFGERDLRTVTGNTRQDAEDLLREAAAAGIQPRVSTYPLRQANRALQDVKHGRIDGTAVLLAEE